MSEKYDLVVLGGGPGGYVAAIRAAQLGLKSAVIDENAKFGGTCLRVGCIPSKALLESSHLLAETRDHLSDHGISTGKLKVDLSKMMERKNKIVDTLTGGIQMLLKKNKVAAIVGRGKISAPGTIEVTGQDSRTVTADKILIATGSVPMMLPGIEFDDNYIGDSTTALSYDKVPKKLVVIGGGYIGLELGSVWSRLGSEVIVLEAMEYCPGNARSRNRQTGTSGLRKTGTRISYGYVCRISRSRRQTMRRYLQRRRTNHL